MKKFLLSSCLLTFLSAPFSYAAEVNVEWVEPEKFRDVKPSDNVGRKKYRERTLEKFEEHFAELAAELPETQTLSLKFTDVDLAGDVKMWHGGRWIRVVKSPFAPMMEFSYSLTDESNIVLKEGEETLRDLAFDMRSTRNTIERELVYEKHMFDKWFEETFKDYLPTDK